MKIVTNAFSFNMIGFLAYDVSVERINESIFKRETRDAESFIGNQGVANRFHLRLNKKPINLRPGDEVYVVLINGGILYDDGSKSPGTHLNFYKAVIKPKSYEDHGVVIA